MTGEEPLTLQQRLQGLAVFLPLFEKPGFRFGTWETSKENQAPYYRYSQIASEFIGTAYNFEWIRMDFDWASWMGAKKITDLRDNPEVMKLATAEDLSRLLTVVIRQDRFCEGSIAERCLNPGYSLRSAGGLHRWNLNFENEGTSPIPF